MKKPYEWILFDADDTLFHFDDLMGLKKLFGKYDIDFTQQDYHEYQLINKPLWVEYQNHKLTAKQVQEKRFQLWADKLNVSPAELNSGFMQSMAEICQPIDGAVNLLDRLKGKTKIGIITNGFTELQTIRLKRTGLNDHIDLLVVSEEVGIAKPHPAIFDHAIEKMGFPHREHVLMVGDNPESDILGAINAGIHSCWVNRHDKKSPAGILPHFEVSSLGELELILF